MKFNNKPKILYVSRGAWDENKGGASTPTNLWKGYGSENIAHIFIETKQPNTDCCNRFFCISEGSLLRRLYKWNTKVGQEVSLDEKEKLSEDSIKSIANQEEGLLRFARKNRSYVLTFLRDLLWSTNLWKTKSLIHFIKDFDPDIVWIDGNPQIFMNRVSIFVASVARKPTILFLQDDAYTYKTCTGLASRFYRWLIRPYIKQTVKISKKVFVASPKMREEYNSTFGIHSTFLAKGVNVDLLRPVSPKHNAPLKFVYLGNVVYGRINSLEILSRAIQNINRNGVKIQLEIYTGNYVSSEQKNEIECQSQVTIHPPVPYSDVDKIINMSDVLVFVESLEEKTKNIARLSFSTKICEYISSGKCILAIGPSDIAPIEYFIENDAAIVVSDIDKIEYELKQIIENPKIIGQKAENARSCALKYHNISDTQNMLLTEMLYIKDNGNILWI